MLLYDESKVRAPPFLVESGTQRAKTPKQALEWATPRILGIYRRMLAQIETNHLENLAPEIRKIGLATNNAPIAEMSREAATRLAHPQ